MTERRRRDGDDDAIDRARAAGPRSGPTRQGRPGEVGATEGAPRVRGAWTTPAVVVRRPDGSIVGRDELDSAPSGGDGSGARDGEAGGSRGVMDEGGGAGGSRGVVDEGGGVEGGSGAPVGEADSVGAPVDVSDGSGAPVGDADLAAPESGTASAGPSGPTGPTGAAGAAEPQRAVRRRPRVRPRRIPGAPGAVLYRVSLTPEANGRDARREPRRATISATPSTPVPPRRTRRARRTEAESAPASRPSLRAVDGAAATAGRRARGRRGTSGPAPRRDGPRRQRVLDAVAAVNFDRLVPADEEARQRRAARLRRVSSRLAAAALVVLVIYGVFPVRTWIDQRAATDRARERLEVFQRENELLAGEKRDLSTDERIEEEAREMGFVLPGEESYGIYPAPPSETTSTTRPGD